MFFSYLIAQSLKPLLEIIIIKEGKAGNIIFK